MICGTSNLVIYGSSCVVLTRVDAFIQDQSNFVMNTFTSLLAIKAMAVVYLVIALFVGLVKGISSIITQHNHNKHANDNNILKALFYNLSGL